jgi:molybdopterin-containing oxidoreductase family membrane subunit
MIADGAPPAADLHAITEAVCRPVEWTVPRAWYLFFYVSLALLGLFVLSTLHLAVEGTGVWGINNTVGWGLAIVNFVFWIGIAHAGTLISAILYLFRQPWRTSSSRFAEAMTIFAVICALLFPLIHLGRMWLVHYCLPLPNQMGLWPNFRSPLAWDLFAVTIYGFVSLLFWYTGLIPDLATLRDRARTRVARLRYGVLALGWCGSARHYHRHETAYGLLAGLAAALVVSVHSVVSLDFAVAQLPGWHSTIFPPYFVAGAIYSGLGMLISLLVVARRLFGFAQLITVDHLERLAKLTLLTGSIVGYAYAVELLFAWRGGNAYEAFNAVDRALGPYAWAYWTMVACNVLVPQTFWLRRARRSLSALFALSILVNVGMWLERFVIVVSSLARPFLPASWDSYAPTVWDLAAFAGSFGVFFTLFALFVRYVPMVAMSEVKAAQQHAVAAAKATQAKEAPRAAEQEG